MCLSGGKIAKQANDAQCSAANRPQSQEVCKKQDCVTRLYPVPNLQEGDVKVDYYWRINTWTPVRLADFVTDVVTSWLDFLRNFHRSTLALNIHYRVNSLIHHLCLEFIMLLVVLCCNCVLSAEPQD